MVPKFLQEIIGHISHGTVCEIVSNSSIYMFHNVQIYKIQMYRHLFRTVYNSVLLPSGPTVPIFLQEIIGHISNGTVC